MKKLLICLALIGVYSTLTARKDALEGYESALEALDIAQAQLAIKKLDKEFKRKKVTNADKKKQLQELVEMTEDRLHEVEDNLSIVGNWRDTAKLSGGLGLMGFGSLLNLRGLIIMVNTQAIEDHPNVRQSVRIHGLLTLALGIPTWCAGVWLTYKGYKCSTQNSWITGFTEIHEALEEKLNDLGDGL